MEDRKLISCFIINSLIQDPSENTVLDYYIHAGREQVYTFAAKHKILPFVAKTIVKLNLDTNFWNDILSQYRERNKNVIRFIDDLYSAVENRGVTKMYVSENFAALLSSSSDIAMFASGDVDNRADLKDKDIIYEAARSIGCSIEERYVGKELLGASFYAPSKYCLPEGFYASLAFYPLTRTKLPCFINADSFVNWEKTYTYSNTHIRLLPPTALAYICMLHTSLHSFNRAPDHRLFVDLFFMDQLDINYDELERWSKNDGLKNRIAVAARISNSLLKTQFPNSLTDYSRSEKVFHYVYNEKERFLLPEPNPIRVLLTDIKCDDTSFIHGLTDILFPDKKWMKKVYGSIGVFAHIKHFRRLM